MAVPDLNWYFSYNLFRLAGITQGIAGRVRDGTAANAKAIESASAPCRCPGPPGNTRRRPAQPDKRGHGLLGIESSDGRLATIKR
jgi:hypothetical protein